MTVIRIGAGLALGLTSIVLLACSGGTPMMGGGMDSGSGDTGASGDSGSPKKDSGSSKDSGTKPDGSSGMEGGMGGDTGSGDGGSCGSSVDAGGKANSGVVLLSDITEPTPELFAALARFQKGEVSQACAGTMMGSCCYEPTGSAMPMYLSAGDVTISDGATVIATLTDPVYSTSSAMSASFTWAAGDTIKVTGAGAAVDAFELTAVAPAHLEGITPSLSAPLSVSLSKDFVLSWTPGTEACSKVTFGFSQMASGSTPPHIECTVDDSAGTLTVPKALLGKFTASAGGAVLQRLETAETANANATVGLVISQVIDQANVTYTP